MAKPGHSRMPVSPGRPRVQLDEELLLELADLGCGYKRIAAEYTRRSGEFVSHMTIRDRLAKLGRAPADTTPLSDRVTGA